MTRMANSHVASLPTPVLLSREMRLCDEHAITDLGIPSQVLMERAAGAVTDCLLRRTDLFPRGRVLLLCGSGNNGGDGLAVARFLTDGSLGETRAVTVIYTGRWSVTDPMPDETAMSAECARQYRLLRGVGVTVRRPDEIEAALRESVCVVDAMLGIGLNSPVRGALLEVIEAVVRSSLPVLAVDIPTGINADDGAVMGLALPARATVTMQALKAGLLLYPGADLCGEITVADIGIPTAPVRAPFARLCDESLVRQVIRPRARRTHKGTYGRVAAFCGSCGMSGAAVLCAKAALRSGAGLVEVITPEENRTVLQISLPEAIVTPYAVGDVALGAADPACGERRAVLRALIKAAIGRATAVVVGCGLGQTDISRFLLRTVLESFPADRHIPLILDADALNLLSEDDSLWETAALTARERCVVLTPHPTEMARLCGGGRADPDLLSVILDDPVEAARRFAARRGVTVVLKDAHTVVASPSGETYICPFGNAGMATGGSGDALAGVIASLLAQRMSRESPSVAVAAAGVALHALAGDAAADRLGEYGLLPSDLVESLCRVLRDISRTTAVIHSVDFTQNSCKI